MITIDDCLECRVKKEDLHLGWILTLKDGSLCLSYNIRDFDWESVNNASPEKVNMFLQTEIYSKIRNMLRRARARRKSMFYQAYSIGDMKIILDNDNVKVNIDKLVRAKARSLVKPKEV